ncbi:unnamed protein product [Rotaria sordida]|uniref:RING-type domain-containing protein n=1 Tax=Rotaria sordida TaxID=392033 RepID=A0A818NBW6_9BILA|nr:unnamed protein product [Rotaria sordida]CAF0804200.1 unnamed protein product [Rotaria sordida]CAF0841551.1 unnamed protein product [Rotaria sordida]CAF0909526.1 unnamed protein product [Rotaria sordida]CAF3481695.1 unnamed protein product [Rotaria sordida]
MANESIHVTDSNVASDEEGVEATFISKDEQMTTIVHENGYESECSSSSRSEVDITRSVLEIEADAFTRFIERQRIEVMFELRHLRLGERPVTGQPNRERIETFLNNIHEHQQNVRTPSTRPVIPSAHLADIDALANRRCVSAALSSTAFRQDLENAIRRSIVTQTISPAQQIPQAPPMPQTLSSTIIEQQQQQHSQITQGSPTLPVQIEPVIRGQQQSSQINLIPRHEPFNIERPERELHAWQIITQLQREIIVLEISDLVHRQLVTSALESDFRRHLEQNIYNHLQRGAPPQEEQQPRPIIATPRAPPVPTPIRTTPNTHASTLTVDELSSRLDTMQQMLQLMFSMQMDMQRSLRQEVASAIANNSSTMITTASQPMNAGHCTICLTAIADTVLYRCGHLCVCYMCGLNLRQTRSTTVVKCPICRAPVDDILRVYRSSRDGESI